MKFECSAQELLGGLINATRALSSRPAMQILEGVLIRTNEDKVELMCSDGSLSIKSCVKANISQEGEVVLPGKLLTEIVRKLPEGTAAFSMNDKLMMTIRCRQSRSTISGMNSAEFPQMKDLTNTFALHFHQKRLRDMISKVTFAIAMQESRQSLTGCLMEVTPDELRLVGLDGFRLALQRMHDNFILPDGKDKISAIIPGRVMGEIASIMDDHQEMITFHLDNTHMMVTSGETTLVTSLLAGEYINYRQILPTAWLTRVTVKRKELQESVERASLMAREGKNNLIRMKATQGNLKITSMSELGDVLEDLDANLEGEDIEIAFNARYISDVVKNVDEECCTLCMNTNVSPCVISPLEGDNYLYLVLPVRVFN
ncbi:MAG: DNA polymerase III subunit beta [Clostridiales bacterium]|nr:DNA polymerase III subunit beta [Clostridiales bacterium]